MLHRTHKGDTGINLQRGGGANGGPLGACSSSTASWLKLPPLPELCFKRRSPFILKREIDSIHVNRDTVHARCVNRTEFHGIGHPTLSLVNSWCVGVCGVPLTRQKRNGGCPPQNHPWESPDRAAERENVLYARTGFPDGALRTGASETKSVGRCRTEDPDAAAPAQAGALSRARRGFVLFFNPLQLMGE